MTKMGPPKKIGGDDTPDTPRTKKTATKTPRTTHVLAAPIVEIDVGERCVHGCFAVASSSATVWNFIGWPEGVEVGPAADADLIIHHHITGENDPDGDECLSRCYPESEDADAR